MKDFFRKNKKIILGFSKILVSVLLVSLFFLSILIIFNIVYFSNGFKFNISLFNSFKNTWYGWCLMIVFRTVVSIVFCFIPGISISLGILIATLYENPWHAFLIWSIGVYVSSVIMYFVGKFGGYKVCEKLLGKEDCEKSLKILRDKGSIYFPITMVLPVFPDDALVMVAGTIKMNLPWFLGSVIIGRGVGVATIVFGVNVIPFERFNCLYDWAIFVTGCLFWIIVIFYCAEKMNKFLEQRKVKKQATNENTISEIQATTENPQIIPNQNLEFSLSNSIDEEFTKTDDNYNVNNLSEEKNNPNKN